MDSIPQMGTAADLELRAARIADPGIDLKTKLNFAIELREMLDTVRDADSSRVLPHMIPVLLEILRSGEPVFHKDSTDYQFRRVLLDILHRVPLNDVIRPQALPLFQGMLYLLRHDNEENGVTCCKVISDILRTFRALTEELVSEFMAIFQDVLRNMKGVVEDVLSEHSILFDSNTLLPSIRSFKVLAEMGMLVMHFSQGHRTLMVPAIQTTLPLNFEVLALESPAQKKAREDFEAMGKHWTGMASTIVNTHAYSDFLNAQIKMVTFLTYVVRALGESNDSYGDVLALSSLRILQDCPANAIGARRELMLAFRHLVVSPYRRALLPHVDKLFNEQVLLGLGVGSKELLRHSSYAVFADLVHYLRNDLTPVQLSRIAHVYSRLIHNPHLPTSFHTLFAKMMFSLIEAVVIKDTPAGTARVLGAMLDTCVNKLEAMTIVQDELISRIENIKTGGKDDDEIALIEKARPVACAVYAVDKPEDVIQETRLLFRTFLHGFRACLAGLRKVDAPVPDGTIIFRLFEGCIRCMALFDQEPREASEAMDWFGGVLFEVNLHVFQEVWTHKMDFYFQAVQKRTPLLHICQVLFGRDVYSPTLVAIVLKFLVGKLPQLGDYDDQTTVATIRLFKMAFGAVTMFPLTNEPILASYLGTIIMDCFPLAAKSSKPNNYFHLLRGLFRAIGVGGGRFELLYKEVLPLLPEMLENMNRQLRISEGVSRDMIVELCLTVPLRLTHLLPHLTYLMQPLALALRGSPELVAQGLRTLELCIDNLTPDFLDPTLNTVLRELTEALHSHLKPLPASHHHAHTTIRILGKLGGRNRRLLTKEPALKYKQHIYPATMNISFGGMSEKIDLAPMSLLASRTLSKGTSPYRTHSYQFTETCLSLLLVEGVKERNAEDVFSCSLKGVFNAVHIPELGDQAEDFALKLSAFVLDAEIRRSQNKEFLPRRYPSATFSAYLEAFPRALARDSPDERPKARKFVTTIIRDLIAMGGQKNVPTHDMLSTLYQLAGRFIAMCMDDSWVLKSGGCSGIRIMTQIPGLGVKWIYDRELEITRTLLHMLKDLPFELPNDVNDVTDVLTTVLRISNAYQEAQPEGGANYRAKLVHLVGIFFSELSSSSAIVRQATQTCIALLVEISGKPVTDLLAPHRERMLAGIYTKPLRALPFPLQIGMIEAVRYCVSMDPPLAELNDELLRLLHETLGLADADDLGLLGRGSQRQGGIEVTKLRVACIKLLTASMPMTEFFAKQHQTRQRVTSVYFKSLYSPSPEIKEVAHEGLRMVLTHQARLPKELLQTGLRPILMNLADPKRLSIPGLEGLARLLGLLTNYFKVEIGHKLLDHFRSVSDPQMLQGPSRLPLAESDVVTKLVRLANIFHLLPSSANIFLDDLVNAVVQTEAHMLFSTRSPFSEPLGKYLDRYYSEGLDFFLRHLHLPRNLRTLRSILQAGLAPNLQREIQSRTPFIVNHFLLGHDPLLSSHSLLLLHDILELNPSWIAENGFVVDALVELWRPEPPEAEQAVKLSSENKQSVILSMFTKVLELYPRVDLIFEIVLIYTRDLSIDLIRTTKFLYNHVALSYDAMFRRNVLMRFMTWFEEPSYSWLHKAYLVRLAITPTLLVHANRTTGRHEGLIDIDFVSRIHRTIWQPMISNAFVSIDDTLKIELLYFTTVLVHHYSWLLEDAKKDIIKCAWHYITSDDVVVKQTAYLLAARFFEAFDTPQKFILRAWTGLLRPPHSEGRNLTRQALEILAPTLPRSNMNETGYPQWAKTTRRLLAEEGNGLSQILIIYHIIIRQSQLFFPVRALFIPHMVNSLSKLGLSGSSSNESRVLSIDALQVIFDWEQQVLTQDGLQSQGSGQLVTTWVTPVVYRETMVSYLVRLATAPHEPPARNMLVPRALALLQLMIGQNGWNDVTVKLNYFSKALEQNEMNSELLIAQALSSARVLQIIAADKPDSWYNANATILQRLVRKGLTTEEHGLHDALHPIFDRLTRLFPLPKDEDDQQSEISEFHKFVYTSVGDGLRNSTALRGTLLMLKSVVQVSAERIEPFGASLMRLLSKLAKEHLQSAPNANTFEAGVRILTNILDISEISVAFLGDQRRWLLSALVALVEKSKSLSLCRYMLDLARNWALRKHDAYPTMKEKASLLQKMITFELRGDPLFQNYLELIYEIYTEPSLRRSDLTTRLEQPFLVGCRARDATLRENFIDMLDSSIPRSLLSRMSYILGVQSWEALADHNWIHLAIHLLLGATNMDAPTTSERIASLAPSTSLFPPRHKAHSLIRPIQRLVFLDPQTAHETWVSIFPAAWACFSRREQLDVTHYMITLLSKDYHIRQAETRPNVIQTLLAGIYACSPPMALPPHLIKYLAKTYGAWHIALELLGASLDASRDDDVSIRDTVYDSMAEVYAELAEEDVFYGLWRRRCLHQETNAAIAFEQNGMWEQALNVYETAQNKTRAGTIPFSEAEYCLWEDHWILSAEKLQQWDTLYELAKNEGNQELMLESAWRTKDWAENRESLEEQINLLPDIATPRRRVFEAFIALLKLPAALDKNVEFTKILEDAMQLSLRKWVGLPPQLSAAHVPLLQHFQQFVELQEAVQIFGSLSTTNAQNLEKKSSDLKMVLQAWRERLPNLQDDISIWSDLVAWRQNVFNAINQAYIPLISNTPPTAGAGSANTFGYRGYHETAWIINRFAHVARKHDLLDVCFGSLNKIYTLPNIEITEAFLKLREQARCHYQKPNDLQAGLEVINNTNLMYFSQSQKAEFYTLKGMFHTRFGRMDDANFSFGQAVQMDMTQAKAWAEWGRFNDRMFKEAPSELSNAANAVSCYLQAAGQYKNGKSRPLLARVLWLLSIDDNNFTISRSFDTYKGEAVFWYWITLIPQLCLSISQREVKQARYILLKLARLYPQALFFHLRTTREDMVMIKKQTAARAIVSGNPMSSANPQVIADLSKRSDSDHSMRDGTGDADITKKETFGSEATGQPLATLQSQTPFINAQHNPDSLGAEALQRSAPVQGSADNLPSYPIRQPWEYVEEIVQILKTASPLLILSMETMVDQINQKFKSNPDEEIYRLINMLLNDAIQNYLVRTNIAEDDGQLAAHTINNLTRMATNFTGSARKEYEEDFIKNKPSHYEYIRRLMLWRDKYERHLDARPRFQPLDLLTSNLIEFQYGKFDDIEIPGQYTEDKDSNQTFVRIQKFGAKYETCRSHGNCWKRFILYGTDNSKTGFGVQLPTGRHCRREERVMQIFRTFNGALGRKKESRKRNLHFHLPAIVSCTPTMRLLQNDSSYISLSDVYERHCHDTNISREDPILMSGEKSRKVQKEYKQCHGRTPSKMEFLALKKEALDEVVLKLIPEDILTRYMTRTMDGPGELWRMRKQFGFQIASTSFMTYVFCLTSRMPSRYHLSRTTGQIAMSELFPGIANHAPIFAANDAVPFRFTPNMQHFLGPIFTEGLLTSGITAIARCLTEPEFDLEQQLCLFARDEIMLWLNGRGKPWTSDMSFRTSVSANIDGVVKRAEAMACKLEREQAIQNPAHLNNTPVVQSVTNLISTATNPMQLMKMSEIYLPWF